jgi:hypothetical protein
MATYRITTPDGAAYNVTAPDTATPDQVMAFAQQQHQATVNQINNDAISQGARDTTQGMSTLDLVRAGAGKAFTDLARGAGQLIPGLVTRQDVADSRTQDAPLMATTAGKVGNIAGNVAAIAPAALIPGVNTIAGGAALGAVTGLIQPSTSTKETVTNTGIGAVAGAAVPLATKLIQLGKAAAEPLYEAGQNAIVGRTLNAAAGKDAPAVAQKLADAAKPFVGPSQGTPKTVMGEYVAGSVPTVGQASENAGVAALERAASANNPSVTNAISDTMKAQNAARVGVLNDMAGADGARDFLGAARDATADQLYGAARAAGIDPAKLTPEALQNIAKFSQRIPDAVLSKAQELAKIKGEPMTDATSLNGLHYVKKALDDLISAADRSGNTTLKAAYTGLQQDLLTGMDNLSPAYQTARKTFQAMSKPINQMDVAQTIADKSVNPLTGNLQPNAFARALSDKTAQQATGFPGATLANTMDNPQLNSLNSLLLDVQRSNAAQNAGRGAGSDTVQKLAYTNLMDQSGMPTFLREFQPLQVAGNLVARTGDALYGRANKEISNRLAEVMLDPGTAAELMKRATPAQRSQLLQIASQAAQGTALAAPASAYALQH